MKRQHLAEEVKNSLRMDPHPRLGEVIGEDFYWSRPDRVAEGLLGALLVSEKASCYIVETEAYFGDCDPASRASKYKRGRIRRRLGGPPGVLLVYGMHRVLLVNVVAHEPDSMGAVLIRSCAVSSREGVAFIEGPGRVARLLGAARDWDGQPVYANGPLTIHYAGIPRSVIRLHRVGVRRDLPVPLRFAANPPFRPRRYKVGIITDSCGLSV